jgi:signal transduction histidine kinase
MVSAETNGETQPAGWKGKDGRLWFATLKGLAVLDPARLKEEPAPPKLTMQKVQADDLVIYDELTPSSKAGGEHRTASSGGNANRIPAGMGHVVEFTYTANTYTAPTFVRFCYRLSKVDKDWCEDTTERSVRYLNLSPGNYVFEVMAANHHGVWNPVPARFEFSVARQFWQTKTFYLLCGIALVGAGVGVQAYRFKWQRQVLKLESLRTVSGERARIARDLHDDLGASLTGIALQLEAAQRRGHVPASELQELAQETRSLTHDLRGLAWATNPRCDTAGSVTAFIAETSERFCAAAGLDCRLELPNTAAEVSVPAKIRHGLLSVLKESLTNIAKHARARTATVKLAAEATELRLTVSDDGIGFVPGATRAGSGLKNLGERVRENGGSLMIESRPGAGTSVIAYMPLNNAGNS